MSRLGCGESGRLDSGREVLGVGEGPRFDPASGRFERLNISRISRLGCEASGRELLPGLRLMSLDGPRDGVGRDLSADGLGRCEDCRRFRSASSEDEPRL